MVATHNFQFVITGRRGSFNFTNISLCLPCHSGPWHPTTGKYKTQEGLSLPSRGDRIQAKQLLPAALDRRNHKWSLLRSTLTYDLKD